MTLAPIHKSIGIIKDTDMDIGPNLSAVMPIPKLSSHARKMLIFAKAVFAGLSGRILGVVGNRRQIAALFLAGGTFAAGHVQATVYNYDLVSQFSSTKNPDSPWGYYYNGNVLLSERQTLNNRTYGGWWNDEPLPDSAYIVKNYTNEVLYENAGPGSTIVITTDALNMDPQSLSVQVQFTAPRGGYYVFSGAFSGHDDYITVPSHPVEIFDNGAAIYYNTISAYGQVDNFEFGEHLNAGGHVVFSVGTGTNGRCSFCYLSTGLSVNVTATIAAPSVPELSTWVMTLLGFVGLGFAHHRMQRCSTLHATA